MSDEQHLAALRYAPQQPQFLTGPLPLAVFFDAEAEAEAAHLQALELEGFSAEQEISENGANISGGEAKRLSLMRLLRRPGRFNFFDEPTAGLDPKLSGPVWQALFSALRGRAVIAVTHDIANLRRFDRALVMQSGAVIADGAPEALEADPKLRQIMAQAAAPQAAGVTPLPPNG